MFKFIALINFLLGCPCVRVAGTEKIMLLSFFYIIHQQKVTMKLKVYENSKVSYFKEISQSITYQAVISTRNINLDDNFTKTKMTFCNGKLNYKIVRNEAQQPSWFSCRS